MSSRPCNSATPALMAVRMAAVGMGALVAPALLLGSAKAAMHAALTAEALCARQCWHTAAPPPRPCMLEGTHARDARLRRSGIHTRRPHRGTRSPPTQRIPTRTRCSSHHLCTQMQAHLWRHSVRALAMVGRAREDQSWPAATGMAAVMAAIRVVDAAEEGSDEQAAADVAMIVVGRCPWSSKLSRPHSSPGRLSRAVPSVPQCIPTRLHRGTRTPARRRSHSQGQNSWRRPRSRWRGWERGRQRWVASHPMAAVQTPVLMRQMALVAEEARHAVEPVRPKEAWWR